MTIPDSQQKRQPVKYWTKCKEIYIGSAKALNTRISLHKSNIEIIESRKLNVSKYLYESKVNLKLSPYTKLTTTHDFK